MTFGSTGFALRRTKSSTLPKIIKATLLLLALGFCQFASAQVVLDATMGDTLVGDQNNDGFVNPGDTIQYIITIPSSGSQRGEGVNFQHTLDTNSLLVSGSIKTTPLALNDTFSAGCAGFTTAMPGVLNNDFDENIPGLSVIWNGSPSNFGQTISVASDGSFTYPSTEDINGQDNFRYAVQDADGNTDTGFVYINVNSLDHLVFVNNSGVNGTGTSTSPYNNLADAQAHSNPGDTIFVFEGTGSYSGGINLQNNQTLIGESEGLISKCITIAPGNRPTISNGGGSAITLAQNNTVKGLEAGNSNGGFAIDNNGNVGTLTIRDVELSNSLGGAFRANNGGALDVVLDAVSSLSGSSAINIDGCSGSFTVSGTTDIGGTSSACVNIINNSATVSFAGLYINTNTTNQKGLLVSGGTVNANSGIVASGSGTALDIDGAGTSGFTVDSIYSSGTSGNGIDLTNNTGIFSLGTLNITRTTGISVNIEDVDTVNCSGGTINSSNGTVLDIDGASLGMILGSVSSSSSSGAGIQLDNISGFLTINGGSITAASGTAFDVGGNGNGSGGSATVTYAGNITNTSGRSVFIQELNGGSIELSGDINDSGNGIKISEINNGTAATVTFSGSSKVINTGTSSAVELADNLNGTVNFTNGGLDIDATSGTGFSSTNGGIVNVSGANNTVTTTSGRAVDIDNGALGITFASISSNGAVSGIDINSTTGSFTLTGNGATGSGITANNNSGGAILNSTTSGVLLTDASNISLSYLRVQDAAEHGINAVRVNNLSLARTNLLSNGTANEEHGLRALSCTGILSANHIAAEANFDSHIRIYQENGIDLTSVSVLNGDFRNVTTGLFEDGVTISTQSAGANIDTIECNNNTFHNHDGDHIQVALNGTATCQALVVSGNTMTAMVSNLGGGITLNHAGVYTGSNNITVSGNNIQDAAATAININVGSHQAPAQVGATIINNIIGTANDAGSGGNSGIDLEINGAPASVSAGTLIALISGNTIYEFENIGIDLGAVDGNSNTAQLSATITANTVSETTAGGGSFSALYINATNNNVICLDAGGAGALANTLSSTGFGEEISLATSASVNGTINLESYAGANNDQSAITTYLQNRNNGSPGVVYYLGGGTMSSSGSCTTP